MVERNNDSIEKLEKKLNQAKQYFSSLKPYDNHYSVTLKKIKETENELYYVKKPSLLISNLDDFVKKYEESSAVLVKFDAMRKSEIIKPESVMSFDWLRNQDKESSTLKRSKGCSSLFEQFLVSNIAAQAFSESKKINDDPKEAERINSWFKKLELDLQDLFEDMFLKLNFKSESLSFEINQPGKMPYTFQSLSSGFSSIMAIYAELITKVSLYDVDPGELSGVVLIDEIDAHLHVSLQKKIFSFLTNAFPKVQYIVTTHSPFVVSSVSDSVIYDLSSLEQVNDLSMYSYESILEGLFDVLPISNFLQDRIEYLSKLVNSDELDIAKINAVLGDVPSDDKLDPESLYYVNLARVTVAKHKRA